LAANFWPQICGTYKDANDLLTNMGAKLRTYKGANDLPTYMGANLLLYIV